MVETSTTITGKLIFSTQRPNPPYPMSPSLCTSLFTVYANNLTAFQLKVALFLDLTAEDVRIYNSAARILRAVSCVLEKGNIFPACDR